MLRKIIATREDVWRSTLLEADHCRKELVIYNALGEKNKSIRHRTHTISTVVMCWKASPLTTKHLWWWLGSAGEHSHKLGLPMKSYWCWLSQWTSTQMSQSHYSAICPRLEGRFSLIRLKTQALIGMDFAVLSSLLISEEYWGRRSPGKPTSYKDHHES